MSSIVWATTTLGGFALAAAAGVIDWREHRIPNRLTAFIATLSISGFAIVAVSDRSGPDAAKALALGVAVLAGPLFLVWLAAPAALGAGDVKLAAALAPFAAWPTTSYLFTGLVLMFVAATPHALAVRHRDGSLPFGPYIVIGVGAATALAWIAP
jgi:leader peptidase (prepilin peptidase) / N-methyltransferase